MDNHNANINVLGVINAPALAPGNASVIPAAALAEAVSITDNAPADANNALAINNASAYNAPTPTHNVAAALTCNNVSPSKNTPAPTLNNAPAPTVNNAVNNVPTALNASAVNSPAPAID